MPRFSCPVVLLGFSVFNILTATTEAAPVKKAPGAAPKPAAKKVSAKVVPAKPAAKVVPANALDGLFLRVVTFTYPRYSTSFEAWYFNADGRVAYDPRGGVEPFNWDVATRERPGKVGTYKIAADQITLNWGGDQKPETRKLVRKGTDLEIDGIFTSRVPRFKAGQKMNGHWSWGNLVGRGTGAVASAGKGLSLKADGTFTSVNVGGVAVGGGAEAVVGQSQGETQGSYTLNGNTLVLKHSSGQVTRHTVYPFGEDDKTANPEFLYFDGTMMNRSKE